MQNLAGFGNKMFLLKGSVGAYKIKEFLARKNRCRVGLD
jgi:hypothetical protein